jgi:hypothetical protein
MDFRVLPALGTFAGGLCSSLLPRGAFGKHGVAIRVAIVAAVSGVTSYLIAVFTYPR